MTQLRSAAAGAIGLAALVGGIAWLIGVNRVQSLLVASVVLTISAGHAMLSIHEGAKADGRWTPPAAPSKPDGTRREVQQLSWNLNGRRGAVTEAAVQRLRVLAEHRLSRHGIELRDPVHAAAAERLLGSRAYRVVAAEVTSPIRYGAFVRCVDAVEQLDDLPPTAPVAFPPTAPEQNQ